MTAGITRRTVIKTKHMISKVLQGNSLVIKYCFVLFFFNVVTLVRLLTVYSKVCSVTRLKRTATH